MMKIFSKEFFFDKMLHPQQANNEDRQQVWAATIALNLLSFGLVYIICSAAQRLFHLHQKEPKIDRLRLLNLLPPEKHLPSLLLEKMGRYLKINQKELLINAYVKALASEHPKQAMEQAIHDGIPLCWGEDKANYIRHHVLEIMPQNRPVTVLPNHLNETDPLKAIFKATMSKTMGQHLTLTQEATLLEIFDQAIQTANPQETFQDLVTSHIDQHDGWGSEKAHHILINLTICFPTQRKENPHLIGSIPSAHQQQLNELRQFVALLGYLAFYKAGITSFLGNFAECPNGIRLWGQQFRCAEAAFQWRKFQLAAIQNQRVDILDDPKMQEFFSCDGEQAFILRQYFDRAYPNVFVANWLNGVSDEVMWEVLQAKFDQNPQFKELLDATQGGYLLEHNNRPGKDCYWSDNHDGSGHNILGKMLMAIRDHKDKPDHEKRTDSNFPDNTIKRFAAHYNQQAPYQIL